MSIVRRAIRTSRANEEWYMQRQRQKRENQQNANKHKETRQTD